MTFLRVVLINVACLWLFKVPQSFVIVLEFPTKESMFGLKGWQTAREETCDTCREEDTFRGDFQTLADKN